MEAGLAEAIVGYRHDALVGPLVLVGAGGMLAELYADYALRLAPVSEEEAATMIEEVKGLATLRGYRNLPRGDVGALARAVAALSRLALVAGQPVAEAEINPLIVKSKVPEFTGSATAKMTITKTTAASVVRTVCFQ